jgi:hypothetical protein
MKTLIAIASALLLSACAGTPPPAAATAGAPAAEPETPVNAPVSTGTRMSNRGTDRTVRSIGNAGAREDAQSVQSLGNTIGPRSN